MKQSVNQSDKQSDNQKKNDFSKGSVVGNIMKLAVPMTLAQLINVLYNIVDRIYIGMIPENATLSLTGLGLCLPDRKSTRLNSSHSGESRMPSSA